MQNFHKRPKMKTDPAGLANPVTQNDQPTKNSVVAILAKLQKRILGQDNYTRLMEMVHQRVQDQYGERLAAAQKDVVNAIQAVLEGVAQEREAINREFLQALEDLEEQRCTREIECYEAAVARVSAACIQTLTGPARLRCAPSDQENTVSSMLTRYSDPFKSSYGPPMSSRCLSTSYESAPPPPIPSSLTVQDGEAGEEDLDEIHESMGASTQATLRPNTDVFPDRYGVRLVPKSSSSFAIQTYHPDSAPLSVYSQESGWPPAKNAIEPNPSAASIVTPAQSQYSDHRIYTQISTSSGYILTPVVQEAPSYRHSCDEFGRLPSSFI